MENLNIKTILILILCVVFLVGLILLLVGTIIKHTAKTYDKKKTGDNLLIAAASMMGIPVIMGIAANPGGFKHLALMMFLTR